MIRADQFRNTVLLMLADQFGTRQAREWEKTAGDQIEIERRYLADPDDVRTCAARVADSLTDTRKTISRDSLARKAFCNSKDLPSTVEADGKRLQWVGIGWVDEGDPHGDETLVVD